MLQTKLLEHSYPVEAISCRPRAHLLSEHWETLTRGSFVGRLSPRWSLVCYFWCQCVAESQPCSAMVLISFSLVCLSLWRRSYSPIPPKFRRAIFHRILAGPSYDSGRNRSNNWTLHLTDRRLCFRKTQECCSFCLLICPCNSCRTLSVMPNDSKINEYETMRDIPSIDTMSQIAG
jgi:hypothetical protein